jgi:ABC-type sugar transport system permease subunit
MSVVGLFMYIVNMLEHADKLKSTLSIVIHTIVALIWTCILNWICKMKYGKKIAWFLVFLPLLLFLILFAIVYHMIVNTNLSKGDLQDLIKQAKDDDDIEGLKNSCNDN